MGTTSSDWIRQGGWWLSYGHDARPTHLLLDGGKACVPDDAAGAFLNAYALAVVRNLKPCVVELRTKVFRLFLDLDIKTHRDAPRLDLHKLVSTLQTCVVRFFKVDEPRAVVCSTQPVDLGEHIKDGKHVVWTNVWVTSSTALAFREAVLDDLQAALPDACARPWESVVDSCVFKSNGLRMPFSAKGRSSNATYTPSHVWVGEHHEEVEEPSGVAAVRAWVHSLSIRTFNMAETGVREGILVRHASNEASKEASKEACGVAKSLTQYKHVLPLLQQALPVQYAGQRFTGLVEFESCFVLRSSTQYCGNKQGLHNTCGVYFVLTLNGIYQGCYCRCDTTDGRRWGLCKDFKSDVWEVDPRVLRAFFPDKTTAATVATALPSALQKKAVEEMGNVLKRAASRNTTSAPKRGRKSARVP